MQTYKLKPDVFEERAQLNSQNVTHFPINPTIYNLAEVDPEINL